MERLIVFCGALHFIASCFFIGTFVYPYIGHFIEDFPIPMLPGMLGFICLISLWVSVITNSSFITGEKSKWRLFVDGLLVTFTFPMFLLMVFTLQPKKNVNYFGSPLWYSHVMASAVILCCCLSTAHAASIYGDRGFKGGYIETRRGNEIRDKWGNVVFKSSEWIDLRYNGTVEVGRQPPYRIYSLIEQKYID